ncbi:lyase family protein [Microbacterium sp. HA-8]|uniref:lyase family protein n=1 Tax=unclassified Microbacterium TaxID=2609290 RepID=UPI0025DFD580|nr:lyase family protein [Microbacterium sp.]
MTSDAVPDRSAAPVDAGLLSPVTAGLDGPVTDAAVVSALVRAEIALVRAYARLGVAPGEAADAADALADIEIDAARLAADAVAGGNPVIPLVGLLRAQSPAPVRPWVHRGATSQDIVDTALMCVARDAVQTALIALARASAALRLLARTERTTVAAARTLTQHAVPTTVGARAATWARGIDRAASRLEAARQALPAQLAGAGGTLAAFVEIAGAEGAASLPALFAADLGLAAPDGSWHTRRWPVTELGDALVQAVDAAGKFATDVATLSRTEIGEVSQASGGGSSAMPQKQNPVEAVLIRSAALRAPQLGATLHLASALAVDERPDGAWHAEWPTLRELLRLALGASAHAASLAEGLHVDRDAVARNLASTRGLIMAERLSLVLAPVIGAERVAALVAEATRGADLADLLRALPEAPSIDIVTLLDPAAYIGTAAASADGEGSPP